MNNEDGNKYLETIAERTRTVTWDDPMTGAMAARNLSGLEYLRAMIRGEYPKPPIAVLLNFALVEVDEGRAVFESETAEYHYNPIGVVHGGLAATLLDSALGCAVSSTLPAGMGYTTVELHVNFVRALTATTGKIRCEAEIVHAGRTIGTAQARLIDENGKLYAHATTTCLIFSHERS